MRVTEIISENEIQEAPAGFIKQGLKKIGAKAAGAVGMKGTAAGLSRSAKTGDEANALKVELQGYLGDTGGSLKQLDANTLRAFLKSQKMPTNAVPAKGIIPKKQIDQILLKVTQDSKKVKGDEPSQTAQGGGGVQGAQGGATQGTAQAGGGVGGALNKLAQKVGGKPPAGQSGAQGQAGGAQQGTQQPAQGGAQDKKVVPMKNKAGIPPAVQTALDDLQPGEKKLLAGLL